MSNKQVTAFSLDRNLMDMFRIESRNMSADVENFIRSYLKAKNENLMTDEELKKFEVEVSLLEKKFIESKNLYEELDKEFKEKNSRLVFMKSKKLNDSRDEMVKKKIENEKYLDAIADTMQHVRAMGWHNPYDSDNYVKTDKEGNPIRKKTFEVENEESSWKK